MGYTSLGGTTDTHPNPALLGAVKESDSALSSKEAAQTKAGAFRPAYELVEDDEERLGRIR
jgi:FAD synthetase